MDAARVSRLQISSTKSQKGLTTDYADSTDEKQDSFIIRAALSVVPELLLKPCDLPGNWNLGFRISREKVNEDQITSIL